MTVDEMKEKFLGMIKEPFGVVFANAENIPCVCIVLTPTKPGEWRTNFVATEAGLKEIGFEITRFLKNFTDNMIARKHRLEAMSSFKDDKADKWFRSIGFQYMGTEGMINRYIKKESQDVFLR